MWCGVVWFGPSRVRVRVRACALVALRMHAVPVLMPVLMPVPVLCLC